MAGNIKGITIEFQGDTSKLDKSLRDINKNTKGLDKELRSVDNALKFNPTSVDLWRQKQTLLTQKIGDTQNKLKVLKQQQAQMDAKGVDKNSAEYRKLQREIVTTESKLKTFKAQLKSVGNANLTALGNKFKAVGKAMTSAGKTMSRYVTAPLVAVGAMSLKAGGDFDTAMSQVAATSGKTVDEIGELRDFAKEMGATTAFSAKQAAEGLNYMALAGYDAETSMKTLPTVLNLAAAGAMDLGAASDMVTDAQTALGLSIDETVTMVDQMALTSSKSNTSVSQLGEAILKIGPTAKMMAGGTKELNSVLGVLADNGIKGSEAGTHLRNILLSLSKTGAVDAFHEMGVEVYDAEGNMRNLTEIFPELQEAMSGLTSEERTGLLSELFNKTDLAAVNSLLDTSTDRWIELGDAIDGAAGSAEKMADTQLNNMQGSLTILKSALEGAGIAISDVLAPFVKQLAEWITNLVTWFNNLSPGMQQFIVAIGAIVAAIGPLLIIFGTLASAIGSIITFVGTIGPALSGVGAAIAALSGPIGWVIAGIAAAIAIGVALYKNWDIIKAKAIEVKDKVVEAWNNLKNTVKLVFTAIKILVTAAWDAITAKVTAAVNKVKSVVTSAFNGIKGVVTSVWNGIKNAITKPIQAAVGLVRSAIGKIKSILSGRLSFPKIKLPHFNITGKFSLNPPQIPKIGVSWYKTGGIFSSPTIAGIGEAGPEAVIPLDKLWQKLDAIADSSSGEGITINVYAPKGMDVNELAAAVEQRLVTLQMQRNKAWGR